MYLKIMEGFPEGGYCCSGSIGWSLDIEQDQPPQTLVFGFPETNHLPFLVECMCVCMCMYVHTYYMHMILSYYLSYSSEH